MQENEKATYEKPEVFELGSAETLTQGHPLADWPETTGSYYKYIP